MEVCIKRDERKGDHSKTDGSVAVIVFVTNNKNNVSFHIVATVTFHFVFFSDFNIIQPDPCFIFLTQPMMRARDNLV